MMERYHRESGAGSPNSSEPSVEAGSDHHDQQHEQAPPVQQTRSEREVLGEKVQLSEVGKKELHGQMVGIWKEIQEARRAGKEVPEKAVDLAKFLFDLREMGLKVENPDQKKKLIDAMNSQREQILKKGSIGTLAIYLARRDVVGMLEGGINEQERAAIKQAVSDKRQLQQIGKNGDMSAFLLAASRLGVIGPNRVNQNKSYAADARQMFASYMEKNPAAAVARKALQAELKQAAQKRSGEDDTMRWRRLATRQVRFKALGFTDGGVMMTKEIQKVDKQRPHLDHVLEETLEGDKNQGQWDRFARLQRFANFIWGRKEPIEASEKKKMLRYGEKLEEKSPIASLRYWADVKALEEGPSKDNDLPVSEGVADESPNEFLTSLDTAEVEQGKSSKFGSSDGALTPERDGRIEDDDGAVKYLFASQEKAETDEARETLSAIEDLGGVGKGFDYDGIRHVVLGADAEGRVVVGIKGEGNTMKTREMELDELRNVLMREKQASGSLSTAEKVKMAMEGGQPRKIIHDAESRELEGSLAKDTWEKLKARGIYNTSQVHPLINDNDKRPLQFLGVDNGTGEIVLEAESGQQYAYDLEEVSGALQRREGDVHEDAQELSGIEEEQNEMSGSQDEQSEAAAIEGAHGLEIRGKNTSTINAEVSGVESPEDDTNQTEEKLSRGEVGGDRQGQETGEAAEKFPRGVFENPALQEEIEKLSDEEKAKIDELAEDLSEKTFHLEITQSKPLGKSVSKDEARLDNSMRLRTDGTNMGDVLKGVKNMVGEDNFGKLAADQSSPHISLTILPHPTNKELVVLVGHLKNPAGTSMNKDGRGSPHRFSAVIQKDSTLLEYVRTGKDLRLIPFVYRQAAMRIDPRARDLVDAPLNGTSMLGSESDCKIVIVDIVTRRISRASATQDDAGAGNSFGDYDKLATGAHRLFGKEDASSPQLMSR